MDFNGSRFTTFPVFYYLCMSNSLLLKNMPRDFSALIQNRYSCRSFDPALLKGILPGIDGYELVAMINVGYSAEGSAPSEKHWSRVEMGEFVTEMK